MGVQHEPFSVAKQATPTSMHPTPDILPLKSRTIFEQSTGNNKHPFSHSKLLQVVQIPKKEKRKFHHLMILSLSQFFFTFPSTRNFYFQSIPARTSKSINPNAMNPQQVRANDSRSWIPRLGNLGQRVGTVVSRCRTPSTQQFVDSFVLHYRGEYRERKRER